MGCGSSVEKHLPLTPSSKAAEASSEQQKRGIAPKEREGEAEADLEEADASLALPSPSEQAFEQLLLTRKWKILMEWCGWHEKDQFGFEQPKVRDILGADGRSKLGGHERPHEYQVAVSFPGAEFVKGEHGHCSNLTDAEGRLIATNGAEMAEAVREWLVEDWLGGDKRRGLTHVFIDKLNLQYCAGSVRAVNFGRGNPDAYAVLNENWAIYLREAFLEARVVVFLLNQDWLDSIPCNQEFEGLIRRKSAYATDGAKRAVVFVDITDPDYTGRLLPQYFANMRQQAAQFFDVISLTYNETLPPERKREVRSSLSKIIQQYAEACEVPSTMELKDMAHTRVQWRNWLYFRCLEGTNGWQELTDVQDFDWLKALEESGESRWPRPVFPCTAQGVLSRRFRLRVTRLGDGRFGEIQLRGWELFDEATGRNIVRPGNGFIRAAGGLNPASIAMIDVEKGAWCHKCGTRQYTWLEWLVPNDQAPVAISHMRLSQHPDNGQGWNNTQCPLDFTLECLPVDVWPHHEAGFLKDYEHPMTPDDVTNLAGDRPPRWVPLDTVQGVQLSPGGKWVDFQPSAGLVGGVSPPCTAFRLRVTQVADTAVASDVELSGLRLKVVPVEELRPIGGGACSGSGGDLEAEQCGPAAAFDGNPFTRWVDVSAGGIGNSAVWEYKHTSEVLVQEYTITSQIGTFGVVDGLHGAPRDWVLYTRSPAAPPAATASWVSDPEMDGWVELDRRADVIFQNTRETKRFKVQNPLPGVHYRLVFSAVRCGCASSSMQVGDIALLARDTSAPAPGALEGFRALLFPSASHGDMSEATWASEDPTLLQLRLPIHPTKRLQSLQPSGMGLVGGTFQWFGSPLSNWYDWPLEFRLQCNESCDGEVVRYGGQTTLAYRTDRFRVEYGKDAIWAQLSFETDVVVVGYGLRNNFEAQPRGQPLQWRFEFWRDNDGRSSRSATGAGGDISGSAAPGGQQEGNWEVLHEVPRVRYDTHVSCGSFYLSAPSSPPARRFRWVFNEWWAPCPLAELLGLHVLGFRVVPPEVLLTPTGTVTGPEPALQEQGNPEADCSADATAGGPSGGGEASGGTADVTLRFRELASIDIVLLRREGAMRLMEYSMVAGGDGGGAAGEESVACGTPVSWVLEGFTNQYAD